MKKALITGVTGQDGSYLSEFLLEKGYEVHGIIRRSSVDFRERIAHLEGKPHFHLHYADMSDSMSLVRLLIRLSQMRFTIWRHKVMCRFHLIRLSLLQMSMQQEFCAYLKLYAQIIWKRPVEFIRHPRQNFMVR